MINLELQNCINNIKIANTTNIKAQSSLQNITQNKFEKFCQNSNNSCIPNYSQLKTSFNDPTISEKMKYSNYVSQRTIVKTVYGSNFDYTNSPYIGNIIIAPALSSQILVSFSFSGNYAIARVSINNITQLVSTGSTTTFTNLNALPNTTYIYDLIPYDSSQVAYGKQTISITTNSSISVTYGALTSSSIELLITGYYAYVSIYRNGVFVANQYLFGSYIDTGLTSGSYSYTVYSYNSLNVAGKTVSLPIQNI